MPERSPSRLRVLGDEYPQAFFFRASEGLARGGRLDYEEWKATFSRLMGIEGKVLDEEIPGTEQSNVEVFTRFKREHPEQLVLLHYNGNARDPRYHSDRFFAGHWLYHAGCGILDDVAAAPGESEIRVEDVSLFRTGIGRYVDKSDDVGLCELDASGRPDWSRSEQVRLLGVDARKGVLRVERGAFGTSPRAFRGGKSYAAAHVTEGPWGRASNLLWYYNYSTLCPRDAAGRTCADVHAGELAKLLGAGGLLEAFDGIEFDVLHHTARGRGVDCDADGQPDGGVLDGVNTYGVGVVSFLTQLRERVGESTLLLADGHSEGNQRGFGILNGIESEGWPTLSDSDVRDWSGGLNRHAYWAEFGREPRLHYINHKFTVPGDQPGQTRQPDVPFATHRLVLAAGTFTGAAICYSFAPRPEPGETFGVWDELRMGVEDRAGWLGKPLGPPVRLALESPDLLQDAPRRSLERIDDGAGVGSTLFRLPLLGSGFPGGDLFLALKARGERLNPYPATVPRLVHVTVSVPGNLLEVGAGWATGMTLRGGVEEPLRPETGAVARPGGLVQLGGEARRALRVHPPYLGGRTGSVFWERTVPVAPGSVLDLYTGMGPRAPGRSDGVVFLVEARRSADGDDAPWVEIFRHTQVESRWVGHRIGLERFAGHEARIRLEADAGLKDNPTTDHGYWAEAFVGVPRPDGKVASPRVSRAMTWVGPQPFTSGFYFQDVPGGALELTLAVEGGEAIDVLDVAAHAAPDGIYRAFERGLVVANPSRRPLRLDLEARFPGVSFRRLQGSPRQDPETNDGSLVGTTLVVPPRDALFLRREAPEALLPESWRARWREPVAADRPLQIVHGIAPQGNPLEDLGSRGVGGVVCNVAFQDYMRSEEHWKTLVAGVETAARLGMVVWIYDEQGYPSGAAGGLVLERDRAFEALELVRDETAEAPFRVRPAYEHTHASNNFYAARRYVNLLDARATECFIDVTHEAYLARLSKHFGTTIQAFFTDEPSLIAVNIGQLPESVRKNVTVVDPVDASIPALPRVPWSADLAQRYRERYGQDLAAVRKSLFGGSAEEDRSVRRSFWALVADLVAERYFGAIGRWCERHGVASSGHTLWEEMPLHHVPLEGNGLKALKALEIPGLDLLSSDPEAVIHTGWMTAALPASAGFLSGRRRLMTEVSDFVQTLAGQDPASLDEMLATAGWQASWGVTEFTLYYQPSARSSEDYRAYCRGVGRLNAVLKDARWTPDVLLYYPIEDLWEEYLPVAEPLRLESQTPRARRLVSSFMNLGQRLQRRQVPFCLVDHEDLAAAEPTEDGALRVAGRLFRTLVLPEESEPPAEAAGVLERFEREGGTVVRGEKELGSDLAATCGAPYRLEPASERVALGSFAREGRGVVVVVNVGSQPYAGALTAPGSGEWLELDPESGSVRRGRLSPTGAISLELPPRAVRILVEGASRDLR